MSTGLVVSESTKGYVWVEEDGTRTPVWVHARYVVGKKYLHIGDRVRFNLVPNPRKPGEMMGVDVEIIGFTVARQVGERAVRP
jgi:cold shock CspA family protein